VERRERLEAEMLVLQGEEMGHRESWVALLAALPIDMTASFRPRDVTGVALTPEGEPRELLHPAFRPEDPNDKLTASLKKNTDWPAWLQDVWSRTIEPSTDDGVVTWQTPAAFADEAPRAGFVS
jgi:hypothetical protein